jgi:DNA-binding CsgD family transcriptional regulator
VTATVGVERPVKTVKYRPAPARYLGDLTSREIHVICGIARGRTQKKIALDLDIGVETVKSHTHRALKKTQCHLHAELVSWMYRHGYMAGFKPEILSPPELTRREKDFIRYFVIGMSAEEIGKRTITTPGTVKTYNVRIRRKFGATNRAHLAALAWQCGIAEKGWWDELGIKGPGPIPKLVTVDEPIIQWYAPRQPPAEESCPGCGLNLTGVTTLTPTRVRGSDGTIFVQDRLW